MKRMMYLLVPCLLAMGCSGIREAGKPGMALWSHPEVNSSESCELIGGYWFRSRNGDFLCDERVADAGKTCKDNAECLASCLAPAESEADSEVTGTCDRWNIQSGRCVNEVHEGRAMGKRCDN
jgi:hypothetical protein